MQREQHRMESGIAKGIIVVVIAIVVLTQVGMIERGRAETFGMGQVAWSMNIGNIGTSPKPPAIGDIDGDGLKEIIIASNTYVYCISSSGTSKWSKNLGTSVSMPVLEQADTDKGLEIFIYGSSTLFCLRGNGSIKWQASVPNTIAGNLAIADVDQDNITEVYLSTSNNRLYCYSGNNGTMKWVSPANLNLASLLIAGTSADGSALLHAGSTNGTLTCMIAKNGSIRWTTTFTNTTITPLAACDAKGDGTIDIIVKTSTMACVCSVNGSIAWQLPSLPSSIDIAVTGDVNRDGCMEIVTASSGSIMCFSASTGTRLWKSGSSYKGGAIHVADVNYDHKWEICFFCSGDIIALSGIDGTITWDDNIYYSFISKYYMGSLTLYTFTLNDVNDDEVLEIVYYYYAIVSGMKTQDTQYVLECAHLIGPSWSQSPSWSCIAGSILHTNTYLDLDQDSVSSSMENVIGTNPLKNDSDDDELTDGYEINNFTNPLYNRNLGPYKLIMNCSSEPKGDEWPMFRGRLNHTGVTSSTPVQGSGPIWISNLPQNSIGNAYMSSSPAVAFGRVYFGSDSGYLYCLNARTGSGIWSYWSGTVDSSPAIAGGFVYYGSSGSCHMVFCLNASTGAKIWSYTTSNYVYSSPAVAGGRVYVGSNDGKLYCLNAATGAYLWAYSTGGIIWSSPAVVGERVYVGSESGYIFCLNATTGSSIWSYWSGTVDSSPAIADGFIYYGSMGSCHLVFCLNASTGAYVWSYDTGGVMESSPAIASGRLYIGSDNGKLYCLNATTGSFIWSYTTYPLNGSGYQWLGSSPAVTCGFVYVGGGDKKIYCLNAITGAFVWSYNTSNIVGSSPAVVGGRVYVGSYDGRLYCMPMLLISSIPSLPSMPRNFEIRSGDGQAVLSWLTPVSNGGSTITNYQIFQGTTSGNETLVATIGNKTTYTIMGLTNGQAYYFKVAAVNVIGAGANSTEVSATPATVPGVPTSFTATPGNSQVVLNWAAPASNGGSAITGYRIYQGTMPGGEILLATIGNVTSYTSTSLTNGQNYYFKVAAMNAVGTGANATEMNITPATLPGTPTRITAMPGNEQIVLTWIAPGSNGGSMITGFCIYKGTISNGETLLATVDNVLTYTVINLTNGQVYYFTIAAVNAIGTGANSTEASATPAMVPGAPRSLTMTTGDMQVVITWAAPASNGGSAITNYRVYRGMTSGGETLLTAIGNVTTWTDTGVVNGQTYYYEMSAVSSAGEGSRSNEAYARPAIIPISSDPAGDEWPMFLGGLNHTGITTTISAKGTGVRWSFKTANLFTMTVAGGRVFAGTDNNNVYCLNANTGAIIWSHATGGYIFSAPAIAGERLYVGSDDYKIYCLNATTGELIWSYKTNGSIETSPSISGGYVYVGDRAGYFYCLNADTGAYAWSHKIGSEVLSSPAVVGTSVYVGASVNVYSFNGITGAQLWKYATKGWIVSSPVVAGGRLYIGCLDGKIYCLNANTGASIWNYTTGDRVFSSPAISGTHVYVGSFDGYVYCLKNTNGAIVWNLTSKVKGN